MTPLCPHLWCYQWQCPCSKPGNLTHRQETQVRILGPHHLAWAVVLSLKKAKLILFGSISFLSRNQYILFNNSIHAIEILLQLFLIFLVNMGILKIWWKLWMSIIQIPNFATRQALYQTPRIQWGTSQMGPSLIGFRGHWSLTQESHTDNV